MAPPTPTPGARNGGQRLDIQAATGSTSRFTPGDRPSLLSVDSGAAKKKKHRAGRKKRNRRQSFVPPPASIEPDDIDEERAEENRASLLDGRRPSAAKASFYRLNSGARSNTSLDSEELLDHRDHKPFSARRRSNSQSIQGLKSGSVFGRTPQRAPYLNSDHSRSRQRVQHPDSVDEEENEDADDRTPLISSSHRNELRENRHGSGYGGTGSPKPGFARRSSNTSPDSRRIKVQSSHHGHGPEEEDFHVNNPPSVPSSPKLGSLDDVMIAEEFSHSRGRGDAVINIDGADQERPGSKSSHASSASGRRRNTRTLAEQDVCYPGDVGMSELGEDDYLRQAELDRRSPRRRRRRQWPDLDVLDEWSREEKEYRDIENVRAKKITEPVMVGGRLRPSKTIWHREEDDAPYRYTYFNESFDATIHSRTISELCQFGATFEELFRPQAPELSESSDEEEEHGFPTLNHAPTLSNADPARGRPSIINNLQDEMQKARSPSGSVTPAQSQSQPVTPMKRQKRYGPRPTFWLDVLSPTETEMKVLAKAFRIHQLTIEDIMMQEPREKVELFQNYYFVNYRSFEQDQDSEDYLEPVNIYVVVFRDGVLSFHFSMTPHPANVRRRIRQLNDYMSPSADWMSYAIIDDVTDTYAPLVQQIEEEVDEIDEEILGLHSKYEDDGKKRTHKLKDLENEKTKHNDSRSEKGEPMSGDPGGDMLRRVGTCRKKVMSLYRLLGTKADVIKGFAKRCNEQWDVAPRSEIGLYLGDIQDHIVTMTANLSHYEKTHSNYLAQINIRMNERAEKTNDVLGKLTVLGTIVLPMNIITGMWGMNVWVPGQDIETLTWFWCITAGLVMFGLSSFFIAKRVYGIV